MQVTDPIVAAVFAKHYERHTNGVWDGVDGKVEPESIVGSEEEREIEARLDVHSRNIRRSARRTKALEEQAVALKRTVETLSDALRVTQEELAGVKTQYTQNIERLSAELAATAQQLQLLQTRVG